MSRMLRRLTIRAAVAGSVVLGGLYTGIVSAQVLPADVFKIDRFSNIRVSNLDGTVRITNPGSPGLRAWGTHVEVLGKTVAVTETPFQDASLSPAEFNAITEKCADIFDNGSGFGVCNCDKEQIDGLLKGHRPRVVEEGTVCANIYVFAADQQLTQCCACPVTPNGLLTLSVRNDLTDNPLTGDFPERGVIKLLSSPPGALKDCDPTAPALVASSSSTTTTTTPTTTSSTTTPTTPGSTTTTVPGAQATHCELQDGISRLVCGLGNVAVDPGCDFASISPPVQRLVVRKVTAIRSRLQGALNKGNKSVNRMLSRSDVTLTSVQQSLAKAARRRRITASCHALLQGQIADLRVQVASLRK
jgi:hypothetical protein